MQGSRRALSIALCLASASGPACSQSFQRLSNGADLLQAWDVERTPDGGFVTAGACSLDIVSPGIGDRQALITKYDADGAREWLVHYGQDGVYEYATSVDNTSDGGYAVACIRLDPVDNPGHHLAILKLDATGAVQWARTYPVLPTGLDPVLGVPLMPAIREIDAGQLIVVGPENADGEGFVLRLWPNGDIILLRNHRVGDPATTPLVYTDVKRLPGNDLLVSGMLFQSSGGIPTDGTPALVRMDDLGNPIWSYTYDDPADPFAVASGTDVSPDGQVCVLTSANRDATPSPATGEYYGLIHWLDPADGSLFSVRAWPGFHPARAGVRIDQTADRYEVISAGLTRTAPDDAQRAAARIAAPTAAPGAPTDASIETFTLPNTAGRMASVAPPQPNACNWIIAGLWVFEPADTPVGLALASTDFEYASTCTGSALTPPDITVDTSRNALAITSFPVIVLEPPGTWSDGPARALSPNEITYCSSPLCTPCVADCNGDDTLNVDDVDCFVAGFLASDLATADCNGDGTLNVDDVDCFVAAFLAGCP